MIKVVVFDLDDTLYEEVEYCRSGFKACGEFMEQHAILPASISAELVSSTLWAQFQSGNVTRTFNGALESLEIPHDHDLITKLVAAYREHEPELVLPADSKSVLDKLAGEYDLALLSDGFLPAQQLKVRALGIESYFKCMVFTEEMGRDYWKPHPAGFERIVRNFGITPKQAVYVGDNVVKDFIAPNDLGFSTVQLIRQKGFYRSDPQATSARPDYVIENLMDLPELLQGIA